MNTVKPTKLQLRTLQNLRASNSIKHAMISAGYSPATATHPKQNFIARVGTKAMLQQYQQDLLAVGVSTALLAELQKEGLLSRNLFVRLAYVKEVKRDLGIERQIMDGLGVEPSPVQPILGVAIKAE